MIVVRTAHHCAVAPGVRTSSTGWLPGVVAGWLRSTTVVLLPLLPLVYSTTVGGTPSTHYHALRLLVLQYHYWLWAGVVRYSYTAQ